MSNHVDTLIDELTEISEKVVKEEEVKKVAKKPVKKPADTPDADKKKRLKEAAASGEISRTIKSIDKLSAKGVESAYAELENLKHIKRQEFLCKLVLGKFSGLLGYLGLVNDADALKTDLQEDQLLNYDVIRVIEYVEPYVPLVGILSGTVTVASHALSRKDETETT